MELISIKRKCFQNSFIVCVQSRALSGSVFLYCYPEEITPELVQVMKEEKKDLSLFGYANTAFL